MTMQTPKAVLEQITCIVREALDERFGDEYVFDPIVVVEKPNFWGEPFIFIYVAYKGTKDYVDPDFTLGLV